MDFEFLFKGDEELIITEYVYEGDINLVTTTAGTAVVKTVEGKYKVYYIFYKDGDDIEDVVKRQIGTAFYDVEENAVEAAEKFFNDNIRR